MLVWWADVTEKAGYFRVVGYINRVPVEVE